MSVPVCILLRVIVLSSCALLSLAKLQSGIEEAVDTLDLVYLLQGRCIVLLEICLTRLVDYAIVLAHDVEGEQGDEDHVDEDEDVESIRVKDVVLIRAHDRGINAKARNGYVKWALLL